MSDRTNSHINEEESVGMVSEQIPDTSSRSFAHVSTNEVDFGNFDFGFPKTEKEKLDSINQAERDMADENKWIPSEQMWAELRHEFLWLK